MPRSELRKRRVCKQCARADVTYGPCKTCGKMFNTNRGRRKSCSEKCRRPPVIVSCAECGKDFRAVPSDRRRFCTARCYRRHTGETRPETNVRLALQALGKNFVQEHVVAGWIGPIDFYLPDQAIAVEVDEPYWHNQVRARDARKDSFMQSRGITVLRLTATPFYDQFTDRMIAAVRDALAVAENAVPTANPASLHPLQLALPLDQNGVVQRAGD